MKICKWIKLLFHVYFKHVGFQGILYKTKFECGLDMASMQAKIHHKH